MAIKKVAIAGAGVMGASIAQVCAQYGYNVLLWGHRGASLEKGRHLIELDQYTLVSNGTIGAQDSKKLIGLIEYGTSLDIFSEADLICEAIVEDLETKRAFFRSIAPLLQKEAIVTSNTSGLSINALAESVSDKSRFSGMHWINPPHLIPLVEVIRNDGTSDDTVNILRSFLNSLQKVSVLVKKDVPGFILNRLQFAVLREALHLVESDVAAPEDVDNTFKHALGIRYACCGPFEVADLGGLDTFSLISEYLFANLDNSNKGSPVLSNLVAHGKLGVKSGAGFYDYSGDKAEKAIEKRDENCIKIIKVLKEQ